MTTIDPREILAIHDDRDWEGDIRRVLEALDDDADSDNIRRMLEDLIPDPPRMALGVGQVTRTLADMTPAERAACVGRWATFHGSTSLPPVIIWDVEDDIVWRLSLTWHEIIGTDLDQITPRLDLPRAWTPTGEPADMDVETGRVEYGRIWYGSEIMERTNLPDGTTVHRHVTDWEVTP